MDRLSSAAVRNLIITVVVAIALLLLYRFWPEGPFSGLAIAGFGLVAGPIFILVLIDTGRAFRRRHLSRTATVVTWLPQMFLASIACIAGMGGFGLSAFGQSMSPLSRMWGAAISLLILSYGIHLLRETKGGGN
jgi:hypothetical protein